MFTGAVELINVSDQLKGLKYRPGMTKWIHTSKDQEQLMERAASSGYSTEECGLEKWSVFYRILNSPQSAPKTREKTALSINDDKFSPAFGSFLKMATLEPSSWPCSSKSDSSLGSGVARWRRRETETQAAPEGEAP